MEWIDIETKLPEVVIDKNGACNGVLAWLKVDRDSGYQYCVSNTEYVNIHPEEFTHWIPLPKSPMDEEKRDF